MPIYHYVPEGKILKLGTAYTFVGPHYVKMSGNFKLPGTYTDGTKLHSIGLLDFPDPPPEVLVIMEEAEPIPGFEESDEEV